MPIPRKDNTVFPRTVTQQRRYAATQPKPQPPIKATIWHGKDQFIDHDFEWNVQIHHGEWGNDIDFIDPGFDTCDEAYAYIESWAKGRGVLCTVKFAKLVG